MNRIVVVSGGTSDPSSTRMLTDRITQRLHRRADAIDLEFEAEVIELRPLVTDVAASQVAGFAVGGVQAAADALGSADAVIVGTPVYKAGVSGLVKSFLDVLDQDLLVATPVLLAATAGTARHALVVDGELRSLFAYLRALTVPTGVFAAGEDWGSPALADRIDRAVNELVVLLGADVRAAMRGAGGYQRVFGGASERSTELDLDSDLMRLAAGGR